MIRAGVPGVRLICEVNDRMAASFERLPFDGPKAFICECGAVGCTERVSLTLDEYRAIRAHPERIAIAPDHAATPEVLVGQAEPLLRVATRA
jgi:hypothetical protein